MKLHMGKIPYLKTSKYDTTSNLYRGLKKKDLPCWKSFKIIRNRSKLFNTGFEWFLTFKINFGKQFVVIKLTSLQIDKWNIVQNWLKSFKIVQNHSRLVLNSKSLKIDRNRSKFIFSISAWQAFLNPLYNKFKVFLINSFLSIFCEFDRNFMW